MCGSSLKTPPLVCACRLCNRYKGVQGGTTDTKGCSVSTTALSRLSIAGYHGLWVLPVCDFHRLSFSSGLQYLLRRLLYTTYALFLFGCIVSVPFAQNHRTTIPLTLHPSSILIPSRVNSALCLRMQYAYRLCLDQHCDTVPCLSLWLHGRDTGVYLIAQCHMAQARGQIIDCRCCL